MSLSLSLKSPQSRLTSCISRSVYQSVGRWPLMPRGRLGLSMAPALIVVSVRGPRSQGLTYVYEGLWLKLCSPQVGQCPSKPRWSHARLRWDKNHQSQPPQSPFPPFSPSLISLMVSVDVKHHVYLLTPQSTVSTSDLQWFLTWVNTPFNPLSQQSALQLCSGFSRGLIPISTPSVKLKWCFTSTETVGLLGTGNPQSTVVSRLWWNWRG